MHVRLGVGPECLLLDRCQNEQFLTLSNENWEEEEEHPYRTVRLKINEATPPGTEKAKGYIHFGSSNNTTVPPQFNSSGGGERNHSSDASRSNGTWRVQLLQKKKKRYSLLNHEKNNERETKSFVY